MSHEQDYFLNHSRTSKFPWSLYHQPILNHWIETLKKVSQTQMKVRILAIGPGSFEELHLMPENCELCVVDIDPRVITHIKNLKDSRIREVRQVSESPKLEILGTFDFIYAKEVIEHIVDADEYITSLKANLAPQGTLWLSTPNYGYFLLPLLESTFLEAIARRDGYSRKHIHPNKYSVEKFRELFKKNGFSNVQIQAVSLKMALVGTGSNK